jgi:hypothetical protein
MEDTVSMRAVKTGMMSLFRGKIAMSLWVGHRASVMKDGKHLEVKEWQGKMDNAVCGEPRCAERLAFAKEAKSIP